MTGKNRFEGKTVLVTGVTRGLGASLTKQLLEQGSQVIGIGTSREGLEAFQHEMVTRGFEARLRLEQADVSIPGSVDGALSTLKVSSEEIDMVIANAGIKIRSQKILDLEAVSQTFRVNVFGLVQTIAAVLPAMIKRNEGHLVLVSSLGRLHGMRGAQGYNASKSAVSNLADSLQIDLVDQGITGILVTLVEPGLIQTDMVSPFGLQKILAINVEKAAEKILRGLARGQRRIAFPFGMIVLAHILSLLPWQLRALLLCAVGKDKIKKKP